MVSTDGRGSFQLNRQIKQSKALVDLVSYHPISFLLFPALYHSSVFVKLMGFLKIRWRKPWKERLVGLTLSLLYAYFGCGSSHFIENKTERIM